MNATVKRALGLCVALLVVFAAQAQAGQVRADVPIVWKYDVDSAGYTYCNFGPRNIPETNRIETSGSSATVTAVAGTPFANVAVGDEITATSMNLAAPVTFTVTARASAISITADRAINLDVDGGAVMYWQNLTCGTADTDGWFTPPPGTNTITISYMQGDLTGGVTYSIETRVRGSYGTPVQADTGTIAAITGLANSSTVVLGETTSEWRVGLKYHTADAADNATNLEQVNVTLSVEYTN